MEKEKEEMKSEKYLIGEVAGEESQNGWAIGNTAVDRW